MFLPYRGPQLGWTSSFLKSFHTSASLWQPGQHKNTNSMFMPQPTVTLNALRLQVHPLSLSQKEVTINASLTHASERYHKTSWCAASSVSLYPHVQHKQNYCLYLLCVSDIPLVPAMADWFCWSTSARSLVTPYHHGDWRQQKCSLSTERVH